jgi:serine/threonine-protein kinase
MDAASGERYIVREVTIAPPRYANIRPAGTGSFASVYAAYDSLLGRPVAIKVLLDEHIGDRSAHERFAREARVGALLGSHPFVVTLHDAGEWAGRPYIVMELLEGSVAERRDVPASLAVRWLAQAAEALEFAHANGIVHRDVKPANLLLDARADVRLGDFGVARDPLATQLTLPGYVVGTPGYLAPEVAAGEPATNAADVYSLAVVARELLGDRPELGPALSRDPAVRPSPTELVAALGAGEAPTRVATIPFTRIAPLPVTRAAPAARRPRRRNRSIRVGVAVAVAAVLAAGSTAAAAYMTGRLPTRHAAKTTSQALLQSCVVSPFQHDANVVVEGAGAAAFCRKQAHVLRLVGDQWTYRAGNELIAPDHGSSSLDVVCRVRRKRLIATVYDSGAKSIGGDVCSWYGSGGWRSS